MGLLMCFLGIFVIYICSIGGGDVLVTSPMNPIVYIFVLLSGVYLLIPVLAEVQDTNYKRYKRDVYINPPPKQTSSWQDLKNIFIHREDEKKYNELAEKVLRKRRCLTKKKKEIFGNPNSSLQDKYEIQQRIYEFDKLYQIGKFKQNLTKEEKEEIYQSFVYCQNKQGYWFNNYPISPKEPLGKNKLYMFYLNKQDEMYKVYGNSWYYQT